MGVRPLARRLGVDPAVLCRPITVWQADRFARAVGRHPADVWGDDWWGCEGGYPPEEYEPMTPEERAVAIEFALAMAVKDSADPARAEYVELLFSHALELESEGATADDAARA